MEKVERERRGGERDGEGRGETGEGERKGSEGRGAHDDNIIHDCLHAWCMMHVASMYDI